MWDLWGDGSTLWLGLDDGAESRDLGTGARRRFERAQAELVHDVVHAVRRHGETVAFAALGDYVQQTKDFTGGGVTLWDRRSNRFRSYTVRGRPRARVQQRRVPRRRRGLRRPLGRAARAQPDRPAFRSGRGSASECQRDRPRRRRAGRRARDALDRAAGSARPARPREPTGKGPAGERRPPGLHRLGSSRSARTRSGRASTRTDKTASAPRGSSASIVAREASGCRARQFGEGVRRTRQVRRTR